MTGASMLHNMSVPPRSTVAVRRCRLRGRYFELCEPDTGGDFATLTLASRVLERHGAVAALVMIGHGFDPEWVLTGDFERTARRLAEEPEYAVTADSNDRLNTLWHDALAAAGVPAQLGIFAPGGAPRGRRAKLDEVASLAVLARRSGPLYLPERPFEPSLIRIGGGVLFFPDAGSANTGGRDTGGRDA